MRQSNKEFNENFRRRTKLFAISVIKFCESFKQAPSLKVIQYQLLKSSTSVAANFRAATRGRSKAEFFSKICIVVEEADETQFWLELLEEAKLIESEKIAPIYQEATEVLAVVTSIKNNLRK